MPEIKKENVYFIGLNHLDRYDQKRIKDIIYNQTSKLEREFKGLNALRFHFKKYDEGGSVKYSVHLLIDGPTRPIVVDTNTSNWDAVLVVNRIFDKARLRLEKIFKNSSNHRNGISKKERY